MATPFLDNFTEASDTNLESHTPSGGTAWTLTGAAGAVLVNAAADLILTRTTTASIYKCDDQGSANQYIQARLKTLSTNFPNSYIACRLTDASNFVGWRCFGTGAAGLRLCETVSGTVTDKYTFQGVDESVYRVEVSGTTAKIFEDGVQKGTDQTVASSIETSQGLRIGSVTTTDWIDDFEAGALGGGGVTGTIAVTLAAFTSSITGTTTVVGTTAATMAAFTSAITGTSEIPGTIAAVTEDAVGALDGTVGTGGPTGTIAGLGADFTASMMGTTTVVGASSAQMEDFLSSIAGTTTVVGTMAITSDDMIMTANGFVGDAPTARFRTLVGMGE